MASSDSHLESSGAHGLVFTVRLLGSVSLDGPAGPLSGRVVQRRRLALLTILAAQPGRTVSRDRVIGLLWPESSSEDARHSLSDSVYVVRRALGEAALLATGDDLCLNASVVRTDVGDFEEALASGAPERAAEVYAGPFLDGFHLDGAPEFERWVEQERDRLAGRYASALKALAEERRREGDAAGAADWLRHLVAHQPFDAGVVLRLMEALEEAGDAAGALRQARIHEMLLREELGLAPSAEVIALAERIRSAPKAIRPADPIPDPAPVVTARREPWSPSPPASVAVLPFVELGGGSADGECFGDGMAEELIHALAGVPGLRVAARTSAFTFRNRNEDIREIARALRVVTVFEGSIRRSGPRLRITAQLIDAADGFHLWSGTFDRESEDVLAVQEEIAREIVRALRGRLGGHPGGLPASRRTSDPHAHALYLRGLGQMWSQWGKETEGYQRAVTLFEQAIARDPEYALPHAGLASTYLHTAVHQRLPEDEAYARARAAATRAMELDPLTAQAQAVLAHVRLYADWDWTGAEQAYLRAMELSPSLPEPHQGYAWWLAYQGQGEEAVREAERAWDLDPLSPVANTILAYTLLWAGQYERAVEQCEHALSTDPRSPFLHQVHGLALLELGMGDRARAALDRAVEVLPGHPILEGCRGYAHAVTGYADVAREVAQTMERSARSHDGDGMSQAGLAMVWAGLGEMDRAFRSLVAAHTTRSPWLLALTAYPTFSRLRQDLRYWSLAEAIGLNVSENRMMARPVGPLLRR